MDAPRRESFLHLDAVLTPTRSLSRAGLYVLLAVLGAFNGILGVLFLIIGATPVPIFLGLDFLGVLIAFQVSYRQARLSADEITVSQEIGQRRRTLWRSPTAFTGVSVEARGQPETRVTLRLSGRSLVVGGQVSPQERTAFAEALEAAIRRARAERYS